MDNRLKFLYCMQAELRGRMRGGCAGKGKTGASARGGGPEKPSSGTRRRDAERKRVAKHPERVPRKAAIALHAPVP